MNSENNQALIMAPASHGKTYRLGELFAGADGMALGAHNAKLDGNGFTQAWVNDMNHDACETLKNNLPLPEGRSYCTRVEDLDFDKMPEIDGLTFGFPCNDFSIIGDRNGISGQFGGLYRWGIKALEAKNPSFFVAENVSGLGSSGKNNDPKTDPEGDFITISLLDIRSGDTHKKAGLNWGQRADRNRNEAYIPLPGEVQLSVFFLDKGEQFTVLTDDGDRFIFVRAQANGKALHSTLDNSQIGAYIRAGIAVKSGAYVTRQHLAEYGRTDITFTKIDEETCIPDFRPNFGPGEDAELWQE